MKIETDKYKIYQGDCFEVLKTMPDNSVDSVVTDPPYGLSFMGKKWDYDVPKMEIWQECLRVLKPGGHLLAFAGTRTQHRMACRIEDAGFEIRDMIAWVYGSGFPKSLNIGKAIDKELGNEREEYWKNPNLDGHIRKHTKPSGSFDDSQKKELVNGLMKYTKGNSQWEGWGTALKPALEPITVARKPITEKNIAMNVMKWGTGGINIDECRIPADLNNERRRDLEPSGKKVYSCEGFYMGEGESKKTVLSGIFTNTGRFPSNFIHDGSEEVLAGFPVSDENGYRVNPAKNYEGGGVTFGFKAIRAAGRGFDDSGSAARYFYCAKSSNSERNEGLEGFEKKKTAFNSNGFGDGQPAELQNFHPTVKPIKLMEYLIKLVTPADGIVLDPFMGSGSTGVAAMNLKRKFIGIEMNDEYFAISQARIEKALCPGEIFKALPN